jgi:hypothetical protein
MAETPINLTRFRAFLARWLDHSGMAEEQAGEFLGLAAERFSNVLNGPKGVSLATMEDIAGKLEADLTDLLVIGRTILAGEDPVMPGEPGAAAGGAGPVSRGAEPGGPGEPVSPPARPPGDGLDQGGFLKVPLAENLRLSAGGGGAIPNTYEAADSPIAIYGPSLGRQSNHLLQAFRFSGDSMDPVIAEGGLVIADLAHSEWERLVEGDIYVVCWNLKKGECTIKYLSWHDEGRTVLMESANRLGNQPRVMNIKEARLIGRVILTWREF